MMALSALAQIRPVNLPNAKIATNRGRFNELNTKLTMFYEL